MSELNVMYQFNEKYAPYAGVSIISFLENNKKIDEIIVYIMAEEVTEESKEKLVQLVNQYNRKIVIMDSQELILKMRLVGINEYRNSYATNLKMLAPLYLSDDVKRLLYIDSDTIIEGELDELIYIDMHDKPIAMILDSLGKRHKVQIGLKEDDLYFNGGIILFDIEKWKEGKWTERILTYAQNVRSHYMAPDQDLINIVLHGEIDLLDMKYNLQPIHAVYNPSLYYKYFGQKGYYGDNEIEEAVKNPKILHTFRFLGEFPWHKDSLHPWGSYFDKYMEMLSWKDYRKTLTEYNDLIFKIERYLYRHIPKSIFLFLFKIIYEIFIWKANHDSLKNRNSRIA